MKRILICVLLIILVVLVFPGLASDLKEVLPLTDKIIMLHFDDGYIDHHGYHETSDNDITHNSPLDTLLAMQPSSYVISSNNDANFASGLNPDSVGRKSKGMDFSRLCQWNGSQCVNDIVFEHWLYLVLPQAFQTGKIYTIRVGSLAANLDTVLLNFDETVSRSEAVHVSQLGYVPDAKKYAYVSHWVGDLGGLSLDLYDGTSFNVISILNGNSVFSGTMNLRFRKNQQETAQGGDTPSNNFTGADVWECDFSAFTVPGEYRIAVQGIGCSFPFSIKEDVYREAFITTCRGLYHHRAGIAKEAPYSDWNLPADHHPQKSSNIIQYTPLRYMDQASENGDKAQVLASITDTLDNTWGWYHDAGDWDGYPSHFRVPKSLLLAYEAAPENFIDSELNIPKSGNGIPDILDEAAWLVEYFRRNVGPNSGIFGARIHGYFSEKKAGDGTPSWEDPREWIAFGEEPLTSFEFAGIASHLAWCLTIAQNRSAHSFTDSINVLVDAAESAYLWAKNNLQTGDADKVLNARLYAAVNLFKATGKTSYLTDFKNLNDITSASSSDDFRDRRFSLWSYVLIPDTFNGLDKALKDDLIIGATKHADTENLMALEKRGFRFGGNFWMPMMIGQATTPWVLASAIAFEVSGQQKYLDAVRTTADYFLGGNPLNIVWVTGLGIRYPTEVLHLDSWYDNKDQMVPGIVPYGAHKAGDWWWNGPWDSDYARMRAVYPAVGQWPGHELYFENRYCPITNEYTVHQNIAPAAAVYGYLCAPSNTSSITLPKQSISAESGIFFNYSNPADKILQFILHFSRNNPFIFSVTDLSGNNVMHYKGIIRNNKSYSIKWDTQNIRAGIYIIQVRQDINLFTGKVIAK